MDIYPYQLGEIIGAVRSLRLLVDNPPPAANLLPALAAHTKTLEEQIRPLRVDKSIIGSDIRFPFFARAAGYKLHGDPDAVCGHNILYPMSPKDYEMGGGGYHEEQYKVIRKAVLDERRELMRQRKALYE
jgi:hypothetical protein